MPASATATRPGHLPRACFQCFGDEPDQVCVEHVAMAAQVGEAVLQPFQRPCRHAPIVHMFDPRVNIESWDPAADLRAPTLAWAR